jgi:hypothetical protein
MPDRASHYIVFSYFLDLLQKWNNRNLRACSGPQQFACLRRKCALFKSLLPDFALLYGSFSTPLTIAGARAPNLGQRFNGDLKHDAGKKLHCPSSLPGTSHAGSRCGEFL